MLFGLERIASRRGQRRSATLGGRSAAEVAATLSAALWGDETAQHEAIALEEQWGLLLAAPEVDVFDGWHVFLLEVQGADRFIAVRGGNVEESRLEAGQFDRVLDETIRLLESAHLDAQLAVRRLEASAAPAPDWIPGSRWRVRARAGGRAVELEDEGVFDELVVDHWLHLEQMTATGWWMRLGDARVNVEVLSSGRVEVSVERHVYYQARPLRTD